MFTRCVNTAARERGVVSHLSGAQHLALFFRSQSRIFETCGGLTISIATKVAVMILVKSVGEKTLSEMNRLGQSVLINDRWRSVLQESCSARQNLFVAD